MKGWYDAEFIRPYEAGREVLALVSDKQGYVTTERATWNGKEFTHWNGKGFVRWNDAKVLCWRRIEKGE